MNSTFDNIIYQILVGKFYLFHNKTSLVKVFLHVLQP